MGLKTGLSQSVHNAAAQKRRAMEAGIGFAGPAMTGRVKWIKTGAKQMMKVILAQVQQYKASTLLAPLFIEMENNPKSGIGCMKLPSDCIPGIFCHGCPIIFILSRVLHTIRACISGSPAGI